MTEQPSPDPTAAQSAVEVDVARTGGVAGMTRRWSAQPPEAEASEWISLIDRCPWDDAGRDDAVADGFVWFIRATWSGTDAREVELPDGAVVGAWRELVEAVREWNRVDPGRGRPGGR